MPRFAISAVGRDQPGIVAAVTGVLADHGGNLADSTMATLQGQFAIVLIVTTPPEVDADTLRADLDPVARAFGLVLGVHACSDDDQAGDVAASAAAAAPAPARAFQPWLVTVHGGDRPRIVHEITRALADGGGTIVDLTSRLVGPADAPVYTLTMRAMLPEDAAPAIVEAVRRTAEHLQVHCHLRPDDAELL
jgi:glycine cleavage system transcriptional repressor